MKSSAAEPALASSGVSPGTIFRFVLAVFTGLLVLNLLAIFVTPGGMHRQRITRMVYFDLEANFPTFFNFLLLVGVAALLAVQATRAYQKGDPWRRHWAGLMLLMLLMAFDEAAQKHEQLTELVRRFGEFEGYLFFAWVIPGMLFALAVALIYLRFLLALPRNVAAYTLLGGGMYVAGALGVELVGAKLSSDDRLFTVHYELVATLEESLEMLGIMVFGYGVMLRLADADGRLRLLAGARPA